MKPLGKSSRTLRRTLLAIVIFGLSFMMYYTVALRDFFYFEFAVVLLVVFLFSTLEDSAGWGLIFGNSLNWGLVFGYHFFFGYPYWLIVLYLIGGGLFFGFLYACIAAAFGGILSARPICPNCGKKEWRLRMCYCHACGKEGCDHCMMPLFELGSVGVGHLVAQVCSKSCWENFLREIKTIIDKNMREDWRSSLGNEGWFLKMQLAHAYLGYALGNPKYPYEERKKRIEPMMRKEDKNAEYYTHMRVKWFYNSDRPSDKELYRVWFPENQEKRRILERDYSKCYDHNPEHQDGSVRLFKELGCFMLLRREELGGPTVEEALDAFAKHAVEVRAREEMLERLKRMKWYELRAEEGICDYCSGDLRGHLYYRCDTCKEVFCSQKCNYGHERDVHDR